MRFRLSLASLSCFIVSRRITSLVYTLCLYLYIAWYRGPNDQDSLLLTTGLIPLKVVGACSIHLKWYLQTTQMAKAGVSPVNLFYIVYLF